MAWLARIIDGHRRLLAVFVVALTAAALVGTARIEFALDPFTVFDGTGPDAAALKRLERLFGSPTSECIVLVQGDEVFAPDFIDGLRDLCRRLRRLDGVQLVFSLDQVPVFTGMLPSGLLPEDAQDEEALARARDTARAHPLVSGYLLSPDGRSTLVYVRLSDTLDSTASLTPVVAELRRTVRQAADQTGLRLAVTGMPVMCVDVLQFLQGEAVILLVVPTVIAWITGFFIFRRLSPLVLAAVPSMVGVVWTLGVMGWLNAKCTMISLAIPSMLLIVGYTDAVHLVLHVRRTVAQEGGSARQAALGAVRELGWACALTSLTTAIAFGSLALAGSYAVRNMGIFCACGTVVTFVAVITLVPLLAATSLGRQAVADREIKAEKRAHAPLTSLFELAIRRPKLVSVLGTATALFLAASALRLRIDTAEGPDWAPQCEAMSAFTSCFEAFGSVDDIQVLVQWSDGPDGPPETLLDGLADVHAVLDREPTTSYPLSALSLLESVPTAPATTGMLLTSVRMLPPDISQRLLHQDERCALVNARFAGTGTTDDEQAFARLDQELQALSAKYEGIRARLVGHRVVVSRIVFGIVRDLTRSLLLVAVIITVVLLVAFGSVRYAPITLIPNVLPLAVLSGLMLLTDRSLNLASSILFTICLGIAVDDTIHFVSRYRRELRAGCEPAAACRRSFTYVGRAMVVTTLLCVCGFGGLLCSRLAGYRIFALLAASGFVAALVGDLLILPALLLCLGPRRKHDRCQDEASPTGGRRHRL